MNIPQKTVKTELPHDLTILLLGVCVCVYKTGSGRDICTSMLIVIHNCQEKQATQMSIKGLMDKDNVVYAKNGLCGLKGKFITCFNVNEPKNFMLSESHQSEKDEYHQKRI